MISCLICFIFFRWPFLFLATFEVCSWCAVWDGFRRQLDVGIFFPFLCSLPLYLPWTLKRLGKTFNCKFYCLGICFGLLGKLGLCALSWHVERKKILMRSLPLFTSASYVYEPFYYAGKVWVRFGEVKMHTTLSLCDCYIDGSWEWDKKLLW